MRLRSGELLLERRDDGLRRGVDARLHSFGERGDDPLRDRCCCHARRRERLLLPEGLAGQGARQLAVLCLADCGFHRGERLVVFAERLQLEERVAVAEEDVDRRLLREDPVLLIARPRRAAADEDAAHEPPALRDAPGAEEALVLRLLLRHALVPPLRHLLLLPHEHRQQLVDHAVDQLVGVVAPVEVGGERVLHVFVVEPSERGERLLRQVQEIRQHLLRVEVVRQPLDVRQADIGVVALALPLASPLMEYLERPNLELLHHALVDRVRRLVADAHLLVLRRAKDEFFEEALRLQHVRKALPQHQPPGQHVASPGEDAAQQRVAVRQGARVDDVAVLVGLAAVRDVAEDAHTVVAELGQVSHEEAVQRLLAQIVVPRRHLMRRSQLEVRLHRDERALLRLHGEEVPAEPQHVRLRDVRLHPRLQVLHGHQHLRAPASGELVLELLHAWEAADVIDEVGLHLGAPLLVQQVLQRCDAHLRTQSERQSERSAGASGCQLVCQCDCSKAYGRGFESQRAARSCRSADAARARREACACSSGEPLTLKVGNVMLGVACRYRANCWKVPSALRVTSPASSRNSRDSTCICPPCRPCPSCPPCRLLPSSRGCPSPDSPPAAPSGGLAADRRQAIARGARSRASCAVLRRPAQNAGPASARSWERPPRPPPAPHQHHLRDDQTHPLLPQRASMSCARSLKLLNRRSAASETQLA
eukprot:7381381-Prymnesium_polylepis.1